MDDISGKLTLKKVQAMSRAEQAECPQSLLDATAQLPAVRTAIVNAGATLPMESAQDATQAGMIEPVFFGDPEKIKSQADALDWDISGFDLVPAATEEMAANAAAMAAGRGEAAVVMKGHIHTDVFMKALLQREAGLRTGNRLTHVFHMTWAGSPRPLLITDGAVNIAPDIKTKQAMIQNAVQVAQAVGIARPRAALLSATEEHNPDIPSSMDAAELTTWAREAVPEADVYGPLAFDLAVSPEAARIKGVDNPVAGNADIIVCPELVTGNALFKMMVHLMGACSAGVVLGARVPILLTSRADPAAARLASAALAALMGTKSDAV